MRLPLNSLTRFPYLSVVDYVFDNSTVVKRPHVFCINTSHNSVRRINFCTSEANSYLANPERLPCKHIHPPAVVPKVTLDKHSSVL
jgi:hypothetical protein